ncbi:MAG: hypothetical protein CVU65_07485 [Deltaproteobacteria bacterium HGW-Deltaproteobacteria-22]|nr:MAG: hypothetical protein CVU65_07485 [Deltaproteobacteria bacterium HGW-Deltaproteobacteria-22]
MSLSLILIALLFAAGCDDDPAPKEITQASCAAIQNAEDCLRAGCTPTCDVIFYGQINEGALDCQARRRAGACVAAVPWSSFDHFNDLNNSPIVDEEVWLCNHEFFSGEGTQTACFRFQNETGVPVGVLGYSTSDVGWPETDPCLRWDPDESRFPWEGSCDTLWFTRDLWDEVRAQ